MRPPYAVRLHPSVRDDLAHIAEGLTRYAGPATAIRKLDDLAAALRALAETPRKGSLRDEIAPGLRAIPAAGRGIVVFRVDDAAREVLVIAIGYAGSDWITAATARR